MIDRKDTCYETRSPQIENANRTIATMTKVFGKPLNNIIFTGRFANTPTISRYIVHGNVFPLCHNGGRQREFFCVGT